MTIALAAKVGDGIVIGADSATTLSTPGAPSPLKVYFNAEKVCNLVKPWPIGFVTYGLGGLGGRSINSLAKDLRLRFAGSDANWLLDIKTYTVEMVATRLRKYFYEELYLKEFPAGSRKPSEYLTMGFGVAGYSAGVGSAELWTFDVDQNGDCAAPVRVDAPSTPCVWWAAQPEALNRLFKGWSISTRDTLVTAGLSIQDSEQLLGVAQPQPLLTPGMPIHDAIDLVRYMADVTVGFVRFAAGASVVHPPIDIAAITPHEGFRWVQRKHYYSRDFNVQAFVPPTL
ncbi:MAG TPA: hypothetical protein VNV25_17220 [Gemmatimonadaceae bacterium]|jgi:hypothetical protein|nr:hypothetical protein [Gemmatimonadaceae bacterium]